MGLVHKVTGLKPKKTESPAKLLKYFYSMEGSNNFPLSLALNSLEAVNKSAANEEEYLLCLLEDSVFSSLYVTFYEQIFSTVRDNNEMTIPLIENFAEDREEREKVISIQSHNHVNFIENSGDCHGCSSCDNHADVAELIQYWMKKDITFFENLYVGMQTIQFAMEHLLYEVIPQNTELTEDLSPNVILKYRQEIFNYTAKFI